MSKKNHTYTEEQIQAKIDEATAGSFYWNVEDFPVKTNVIGGAAKQWSLGTDIVYAPYARLCGPRASVEKAFDTYKIEEDCRSLYTSVDSEGFSDELSAYKQQKKSPALVDDEAFQQLKEQIRKTKKDDVTLASLVKALMPGRAVNVTDIANKKYTTVNAPLPHILSNFIGVPGLPIVSKTEEAYEQAIKSLYDGEVADAYIAAWIAIKTVHRLRRPEKPKAETKTKAKKTSQAPAAKKTSQAPLAAKKTTTTTAAPKKKPVAKK